MLGVIVSATTWVGVVVVMAAKIFQLEMKLLGYLYKQNHIDCECIFY